MTRGKALGSPMIFPEIQTFGRDVIHHVSFNAEKGVKRQDAKKLLKENRDVIKQKPIRLSPDGDGGGIYFKRVNFLVTTFPLKESL